MSAISNANHEGKLYYRGYPIEQIVEKSTFVETCYILLYGHKPEDAAL